MAIRIDLNADLGEGFGVYSYGADAELIPLVSSVNIACGWHGGDPTVMRRAAALAAKYGVTVGAHPGYPDPMGFGRRNMALSEKEITDALLYQIGALDGVCRAEGTRVSYVKPHGALYNTAAKDEAAAEGVVRAIGLYDPSLPLLCPAGSSMARAARSHGIMTAREFFADRACRADGSLVPRGEAGAVISDENEVCARVCRAVSEGRVAAADGTDIAVSFDSICLHGDNPKAVALARRIRAALAEAGVEIRAFCDK
ncbi:MAG: LamB/YcsF family protein [Clostridia bacterium]|nr:LamB/YcsF family protein [Clostridia bacterium]